MGVMTRLLLLLWVGVTASTVVDLQKRIIDGQDCIEDERLYHVEVRAYTVFPGEDFDFCGGSLIGNRWILTAAHCWDTSSTMRAVLGIHPGDQETEVDIDQHYIYTDDQNRTHDIMLLELTNPTQIQHVQLPDCSYLLKTDDRVEMAGRGSTITGYNNKRLPLEAVDLQCVNIPVVDCQRLIDCLGTDAELFHETKDYQHWKCYQRAGVDLSEGDSGGGVVFNDLSMIYGVHSFSGNPTHACVAPAGFMDVCAYMDWIVTTTGIPRPGTGHGSASGKRPATKTGSGPSSPKKSNT